MLKSLYEAIRRDPHPPEPLTVKTLSAIEDYLRTNVDAPRR